MSSFIVLPASSIYSNILKRVNSTTSLIIDVPSGSFPYTFAHPCPTIATDTLPLSTTVSSDDKNTYIQSSFTDSSTTIQLCSLISTYIFSNLKPSITLISLKGCSLTPSILSFYLNLITHHPSIPINLYLIPCCLAGPEYGYTLKSISDKLTRDLMSELESIKVFNYKVVNEEMKVEGRIVKDVHLITCEKIESKIYSKISSKSEDDSFWDVAFMSQPPPNYLVPSTKNLESNLNSDGGEFTIRTIHLKGDRIDYECFLGDGVLGNVGFESWDAGFILLDVLMNVDSFKQQTCLELGAGCGFVTLGLKYLSFNNLTTSDYDDGVIELLAKNVGEDVTVRKIDWFKSETYENEIKYDLIIGSAVVYSPEHKVLAKVIDALLDLNGTAIVINMRRPGWDDFVMLLEDTFGPSNVTVEVISEEIIKQAEVIKGEEIRGTFNMCTIKQTK
ncbi:hypothetical protein TrLO_g673 [Triparma laevis f. longispina]|uniref:Uncharacterized protein n=1 Tax=Triparma laevis f. longispina TaxID=1714387 RepID=A0A9W7L012_9STRA|nr:hypothetical protein TrLO_g673 [Triparma laevis f. longispina]